MDLARRLAQFDALLKAPRSAEGSGVSAPSPATPGDPAVVARVVSALGLTAREATGGEAWACDAVEPAPCPPPEPATLVALAALFASRGAAAALPAADADAPAPSAAGGLLLLDTETTGLAGGTGTVPFLIGCAWWEEGTLRTRQWFLPTPGREGPLLADLAAHARRFTAVVTYNGQAFDLPLLRTRALLARQPDPVAGLHGWDLLRVARRLWGRRLPDCRQPTVEAQVCGIVRDGDDLPGALIPQVYFRWLRAGDPGDLPRVLAHNRRDLRGMAAILAAAGTRAADLATLPSAGAAPAWPWADLWSAGRICERQGRRDLAVAWLAVALAARDGGAPERFFADAVRVFKRGEAWTDAAMALAAALAAVGERPWLHREAAILYEHRLRDLARAHAHAQRLGEPARLARLARKLGRSEPAAPAGA